MCEFMCALETICRITRKIFVQNQNNHIIWHVRRTFCEYFTQRSLNDSHSHFISHLLLASSTMKYTNWIPCKWFTTQHIYIDYFHFSCQFFFFVIVVSFFFWFATVLALESKKIQVRVAYPRHPYISIHLRWTVYWVHRCLRGYDNHMMVALKLMSGAINFLSVGSPITQNMDIIFSRGSRNIHILHNMRKYWHSG